MEERRFWMRVAIGTLVVIILESGVCARSAPTMPSRVQLAQEAVIYALPLVIMDFTREGFLSSPTAADATPNRFYHTPVLGNAKFRAVVRPNADTIYSTAWLNLAAEPVLLKVPPSNGRYFMVQCMDAWTNVFADPGIRTLGNQSATYAIVGPDWQGSLPNDITEIRSPTRMVWVLARIYVRNQADLTAARAYQKQLDIRPLSRLHDAAYVPAYPRSGSTPAGRPPMIDVLKRMPPEDFFGRFLKLTVANPPALQDAPFITNVLEPLGLMPGMPIAWQSISPLNRAALTDGFKQVLERLSQGAALRQQGHLTKNEWLGVPGKDDMPRGNYGTHYLLRARVAMFGLAANLREDAIYMNASLDGNGKRLNGSRNYRMTFPADSTPPVQGFWSVTLYDSEGYLVANSWNRYAIRSGSGLKYAPDGSLVIYLQPNDPGSKRRANWLPTPRGQTFNLSLRAYWPKQELLKGQWEPPAIVPVQ